MCSSLLFLVFKIYDAHRESNTVFFFFFKFYLHIQFPFEILVNTQVHLNVL